MNLWRTMDTAPRDGTEFLAASIPPGESAASVTMNVIRWDDHFGDGMFPWGMVEGDRNYHKDWPDFWMPLPDPPSLSTVGSGINTADEKKNG